MPPASEPSAADVAAVATAIGLPQATPPAAPAAPAQPAPAQPQPAAPAQPAPAAPADPFAAFTQPAPAAEPAAPAQPPAQPTEPAAPQPSQPVEPAQPAPVTPAPAPAEPTYQSYEDYMKSVLEGVPAPPATPDPDKVNPDDPAAIKGFFDELINTVKEQVRSETTRNSAIQASERRLWDEAFEKYGSLRTNKNLRDMVHNIRMGYFQRSVAITPTQAADKLLESLGQQYKQGVADSAVVTSIENVQPQGGGTGEPVATNLDKTAALTAVQTGGETALAAILDQEIKAGRL